MEKVKRDILELYNSDNICDMLDEQEKTEISGKVLADFQVDKQSRSEWEGQQADAMKIAKQVMETKETPWQNASNIKYPLMTIGAINFAARAYPEIIRDGRVVETDLVVPDPTGQKAQVATRLANHLNYQLLVESDEWECSMDRLLHVLPILGHVFKKTYWDPINLKNCSDFIPPEYVIVNQHIKSLDSARRVSHVIPMYKNDIIEYMRAGLYSDEYMDKIDASASSQLPTLDFLDHKMPNSVTDHDPIQEVIEQHRFLDLDGDGYEEPYVVTVHRESGCVLRIYRRFDLDGIKYNLKKQIRKINAVQYFTDFMFIPALDGSYYGTGFGCLLYPINHSVNTIMNQLIDAGTLSNMQSGFLGAGFRTKSGPIRLGPGEWKPIDTAGDELSKNIVPLPVREPSAVLLQLLTFLVDAAKEIISVTDMMNGSQNATNVPATTALALIEQGMKVFGSIQKRLYRSLKAEFSKIVRLNRIYLDEQESFKFNQADGMVFRADYEDSTLEVYPVADPTMSSDAQRLARASAVLNILPTLPGPGQMAGLKMYLKALEFTDAEVQAMLPPPDPNAPPPIEAQKAQSEIALNQAKAQELETNKELKAVELQLKAQQQQIDGLEAQARVGEINARTTHLTAAAMTEAYHADAQHANNLMKHQVSVQKNVIAQNKVDVAEKKVDLDAKQDKPTGD